MESSRLEPDRLEGLDQNDNPAMNFRAGLVDSPFWSLQPIRDVDWRDGPQVIDTTVKFRAALGQRCGMVASEKQECRQCARKGGVFASCVVNVVSDELQAGGACMNCAWRKGSYRCSFRGSTDSSP